MTKEEKDLYVEFGYGNDIKDIEELDCRIELNKLDKSGICVGDKVDIDGCSWVVAKKTLTKNGFKSAELWSKKGERMGMGICR